MSLVRSRRSPITGALVAADVVLDDPEAPAEAVEQEIVAACRRALPSHKVPAVIRFVPSLAVSAAGKLVRPGA